MLEKEGDSARAVIAVDIKAAVPAAPDVGLVTQEIRGPDRAFDRFRGIGRRISDPGLGVDGGFIARDRRTVGGRCGGGVFGGGGWRNGKGEQTEGQDGGSVSEAEHALFIRKIGANSEKKRRGNY